MSDEVPPTARPRSRRRSGRARRFAATIALVLVVALVALWLARRPIATGYIDRSFARAGVPARYRIADLGFGRQRLTDVVIGDPARPDLVADWIETRTIVGFGGAAITGVRAGRVRVRGRLVDGRVSLGAVDRLLPAPSGKPFALPSIDLQVADGRMRLETPAGVVGVKLSGGGRLDDGFSGDVAAISTRLAIGGCVVDRVAATVAITIRRARPTFVGPVRAGAIACGATGAREVAANVNATLGAALDRWDGRARLTLATLAHPRARVAGLRGEIAFAGTARETAGTLAVTAAGGAVAAGRASTLTAAGRYRVGDRAGFTGRVTGDAVMLAGLTAPMSLRDAGAGTPVAPLVSRAVAAASAATRRFDLDATVALRVRGGAGVLAVTELAAVSTSGARVALRDGGVAFGWPDNRLRLDGTLSIAGGGLPSGAMRLAQAAPGAPITGRATFAPYAAGDARLALAPVDFTATPGGATRIATVATLSGPLGDGRIEGLRLPIVAGWDGGGRLALNPGCTPVSFTRLAVAGLALRPARLTLCPLDGALVRVAAGRVAGGARIATPRLSGTLGSTPIALAAGAATLRLGARDFTLGDLTVRLGAPERVSRLDVATLSGRLTPSGVGGAFSGGAGRIGNVPLLLSGADGGWSFADGKLGVTGALAVADAAPDARFVPLAASDVRLTLAGNRIAATGTLATPDAARRVAIVTIAHDLAAGTGTADLAVGGISFDEGFQPDRLTRLTFGVIADVRGTVSGDGRIAWTPDGVTSTGVFRTDGTDLAAAFGPVTGIAGKIRFTDLLNLESAPGQVATVASINPGIAVTDGTIRYRTLRGTRVQVDEGRWPFAGGTLTLEPSLLDFSSPVVRALTFRVDGMAADRFLQQFDFKNLNATGTFDGVLPMVFDERGGRIENGRLTVREGGGTIAYVGELTEKDLGFWGDFAFQTLRSLRYRSLGLTMNGPLAGEMITDVRFAGVSQGVGAKSNFLIRRLQRLPIVFNIRIKAPFRGLIDSAQSFYDPKRLIGRNLPALLEEQRRATQPIQPSDSRTVR